MKLFKREIQYKNWFITGLTAVCLLMLLSAAAAYLIDPLMLYRIPSYRAFINPRYSNEGIIRNYDFDSAIVGSSMFMNFDMDEFREKLNWKPAKLCWGAPTSSDMGLLLREVFEYKKPQNIVFCMDLSAYNYKAGKHRSIPEYLYDQNVANDYKYLLGYDTWFRFMPIDALINASLRLNIKLPDKFYRESSIDKIGEWKDEFTFGKKYVVNDFKTRPMTWVNKQNSKKYLKLTTDNFYKNLEIYIRSNTEVNFYIIYPPYSVLPWAKAKETGSLNDLLEFKEYSQARLIKYKNTKVFDFQALESYIIDLDNYKDVTHYRPEMNSFMLDSIVNGDYRLETEKEIDENINKLKAIASRHQANWYLK